MIGRLFRQSASVASPPPGPAYEDSYTRESLYGTPKTETLPHPFSLRRFRLLVAQDGLQKRPLFDSDDSERCAELELMFGRGVPSLERCTATKVHHLAGLVLITRVFSMAEEDAECGDGWCPTPAIPLKSGLHVDVAGRFAIGLVVPQEAFGELVCSWTALSYHLVIVQTLVSKKVGALAKIPVLALRLDPDLQKQQQRLVRLVGCVYGVPRLVSSHALMAHAFAHEASPFKSTVMNWALEVANWLEFKESLRPTFLASLIGLVRPLRASMADPFVAAPEKTRVVVMTGNAIVAKKLVFILNGLLPDALFPDLGAEPSNLTVQPIHIKRAPEVAHLYKWEVPFKLSASVASHEEYSKPPNPRMPSCSSVAHLLLLFNSSLSSGFGSFFDKWNDGPDLLKKPLVLLLRLPSPHEPDEYPWDESPKVSRTQLMLDLAKQRRADVLRTRTCVYVPVDAAGRIRAKCEQIHKSPLVLGAALPLLVEMPPSERLPQKHPLLPAVAYVDEFRPEYVLQACPASAVLETQVMNAMRNDLLLFQRCNMHIRTRTVFVSLRAREVKVIEMAAEAASYKTTVKKVHPGKHPEVEKQLESLTAVIARITNDGSGPAPHDRAAFQSLLFAAVKAIIE